MRPWLKGAEHMWLPVLLAHAAFGAGERTAAPSVVSAPVPELDPQIIGDFFGGSKVTTEVSASARPKLN